MFKRIWDIDNNYCFEKTSMTSQRRHHLLGFLKAYVSDQPNFISIGYKRAEIQGRDVNREL